ncbi:MAG: T9SS type A sorting domain-containing protein [Chitinophagaceae bacterium]|nr:MAG: T9SS type A sorting domain-containing protein [Chitinophagaceae bacterium]
MKNRQASQSLSLSLKEATQPIVSRIYLFILAAIFLISILTSVRLNAQVSINPASIIPGMEFTNPGTGIVQVADVNKDGYPDYFYNTVAGGGITYLQNNAGTSFSTPSTNPFGALASATPTGVILNVSTSVADFDNDGDPDIWCRVSGAGNDAYFQNNNGIYANTSLKPGMEFSGVGTGIVQVADINRDGFPDIIYNAAAGGAITYLQNNGGNSFSTPGQNPFAGFTGASPAGTLLNATSNFADFDGDGDLDFWVRVFGSSNDVYLSYNNGLYAVAAVPPTLEFTSNFGTAAFAVADFNGDGLVDYAGTVASGGPVVYMQNNGSLNFSTPSSNPLAAFAVSSGGVQLNASSSVADFDKDGDLDIWMRIAAAADVYAVNTGAAPQVTGTNPLNGALSVPGAGNIVLAFSEPVYVGTGSFSIRKTSDNSIVETIFASGPQVTGSGTNTITIDPFTNLSAGTGYYLTFTRTALADADGFIAGHLDYQLKQRVPETTADFLSFTVAGTLAVQLEQFTVSKQSGSSILQWQTSMVLNSAGFSIQHSTDGIIWNTIGHVAAANSSTQQQFQFTHTSPAKGNNYYRLKETGLDGTASISPTRLVQFANGSIVKMYPNPAKAYMVLEFDKAVPTSVHLFNMAGERVFQTKKNAATLKCSIGALPSGVYQVVISRDGEKLIS